MWCIGLRVHSALSVTLERISARQGMTAGSIEHRKADTQWEAHFKDEHNHMSLDLPFRGEIVCRTQDHPEKKLKDAITIAKERSQWNSDRGWYVMPVVRTWSL